jgi:hypothetical protein
MFRHRACTAERSGGAGSHKSSPDDSYLFTVVPRTDRCHWCDKCACPACRPSLSNAQVLDRQMAEKGVIL